jgi:hypothetical protein
MSKNIIRSNIHSAIAKSIISEALARTTRYYFTYGKSNSWNQDELPDDAYDTLEFENEVRRNVLFGEEILPDDICLLVNRINWVSGSIYDMYDQYTPDFLSATKAPSLEEAWFYVLTDEMNVYKCIDNNNNGASVIKPTGNSITTFTTADGYVWKYLYTIPTFLQNKFLTSSEMPVLDAASTSYYSNGKLEKFEVSNFGSGYKPNVQLSGTVISNFANYYQLTTSNDLTSVLKAGDRVMVNNQVRLISSVSSTTLTIDPAEKAVYAFDSTSIYKLNTWLDVQGDGFSEASPVYLSSITIVDGGYGYVNASDVKISFSSPDMVPGAPPKATATVTNGVITKITINECGYGYKTTPKITIQGISGGFGAVVKLGMSKSPCYIDPIVDASGQIVGVNPLDRGLGYTFSNIKVRRLEPVNQSLLSTYTDAIVIGKTSPGFLNTQQFNVEMSAIPGAIHVIKILNGGSGYVNPKITISGDGYGALATAKVVNGVITKISMSNIGKNYTYATVQITDSSGKDAELKIVNTCSGGHGSSAVDELLARTVAFRNSKKEWKLNGKVLNTDLRQICLVKSLKQFNSPLFFSNYSGSFCFKLSVNLTSNQIIPSNSICKIQKTQNSTDWVLGRVVYCDNSSVIFKALDQDDETISPGNLLKLPTGEFTTINSIQQPDIDFQSGSILFIDNKHPFRPTEEQSVTIITRLKT